MMIEKNRIEQLQALLTEPKQITIVSHINPDGDAIGSGLAWAHVLRNKGHRVRFFVPTPYP
ncbi:MAG: bifunctional oligoribonuclease/PAP phosphatase NrnA, partial [Rikenellaceae bacterium]|nr:bifunctional oligoribonuclease/PAP phosphatase NrnA [Rikenellaceae bacterium]